MDTDIRPFIKRRFFLKFLGLSGMNFFVFPFNSMPSFIEIVNRIRTRFKTSVALPPDSKRVVTNLPSEGLTISVETALNSRCTSDYDEDPELFHWGMFNKEEKLSSEQINRIVDYIKIPRFTNHSAEVKVNGNILTFVVDNTVSGIQRDWLMIESGMQQQAVCLICAALGVGMVLKSYGKDGTEFSEPDYANVRIKLDAMRPSYGGAYWTSLPPAGRKPWTKGNLPDPVRNGNKPLLSTLKILKIENRSNEKLMVQSLSQLLWAARGRTPHLYKSKAWGMTIPTAGGQQKISSIYILLNHKLYRYLNWYKNRPAQSLEMLSEIDKIVYKELMEQFPSGNCFIVLVRNESFARSLWEIGYQLLNLLLQAHVLDVFYEAILLNETEKYVFQKVGINNAAAVFVLRYNLDDNSSPDFSD